MNELRSFLTNVPIPYEILIIHLNIWTQKDFKKSFFRTCFDCIFEISMRGKKQQNQLDGACKWKKGKTKFNGIFNWKKLGLLDSVYKTHMQIYLE